MKKARILHCLLTACLVLTSFLAFTGCSGSTGAGASAAVTSAAGTQTTAEASAAAQTTASGGKRILRVGFECSSAPFCWTQTDGSNGAVPLEGTSEYTYGFDVAIMKKVCELAGFELKAYKIDWDGMLMGVQAGTIDAAISGISITEKRKASMDFSNPYYVAGIVALVRKDSKYASATTLSGLSGASCTSMLNTIWYDMCKQVPNGKIQPALENLPAMIAAVNAKTTDLILVDEPTALAAVVSNPDLVMIKPDQSDTFNVSDEDTNLGIAIHKGNEDIVKAINDALAKISSDETMAMLQEAIQVQPLAK